jgi:hypothetical protein
MESVLEFVVNPESKVKLEQNKLHVEELFSVEVSISSLSGDEYSDDSYLWVTVHGSREDCQRAQVSFILLFFSLLLCTLFMSFRYI